MLHFRKWQVFPLKQMPLESRYQCSHEAKAKLPFSVLVRLSPLAHLSRQLKRVSFGRMLFHFLMPASWKAPLLSKWAILVGFFSWKMGKQIPSHFFCQALGQIAFWLELPLVPARRPGRRCCRYLLPFTAQNAFVTCIFFKLYTSYTYVVVYFWRKSTEFIGSARQLSGNGHWTLLECKWFSGYNRMRSCVMPKSVLVLQGASYLKLCIFWKKCINEISRGVPYPSILQLKLVKRAWNGKVLYRSWTWWWKTTFNLMWLPCHLSLHPWRLLARQLFYHHFYLQFQTWDLIQTLIWSPRKWLPWRFWWNMISYPVSLNINFTGQSGYHWRAGFNTYPHHRVQPVQVRKLQADFLIIAWMATSPWGPISHTELATLSFHAQLAG